MNSEVNSSRGIILGEARPIVECTDARGWAPPAWSYSRRILAALTLPREADAFRSEIESDDKADPAHPHGHNPAVQLDIPSEKQPQCVHNPNHEKNHGSDQGK